MATPTLPISRLLNISLSLGVTAAQAANTSTLLILGASTVIDLATRLRSYTTLSEVANDFGTTAPEYFAAQEWFAQAPQPTAVDIGRWAQAAAAGQLIGGALSTTAQAALVAAVVANGSFELTAAGALKSVTGVSFAQGASMDAVAAAITTATSADGFGCVWSASTSNFIFTTTATGSTETMTVLSPEGTGTDLSTLLGGTVATGAYVANGQAAESALTAVTLLDQIFGQKWYALTVLGAADADHQAIAPFIEASGNYHYYGVSTQDAGVLSVSSTTDIAHLLAQAKYTRTCVQYSSSSAYAVCSLLGRILTTDYTGNNTTITLMYKQEPGVTPENLTETQIDALESKNCNVFAAYNNNTAIIEPGVSCSGDYIDTVVGAATFVVALQTAVYDALYTSTTKIPQTDGGMNILATVMSATAAQFVKNGLFAPGTWAGAPLPGMPPNLYLEKGYYLYTPPIATQSRSARAARQSVAFQMACKLAGAVHTVDLAVTVNA